MPTSASHTTSRPPSVIYGGLLDALFGVAAVLYLTTVVFGAQPTPATAVAVATLVALLGLWVWWRIRRARRQRSIVLAIGFVAVAFVLFVLADSPTSVGVQWLAVLVLTLEAGVAASAAYGGAMLLLTVGLHVTVGSGLARALLEGLATGLLLAVGIEFAALLRRAERLDAERSAALADLESAHRALEQAHADLARAYDEQRRRHGREQDLVLAEERARIATALHDGLGHRLTAIGLSLDYGELMRARDPVRADAELRNARRTATEALDEMRRVVRAMHPVETDAGDVTGSLDALARSFASTGLEVTFERVGETPIGDDDGLLLLRFAQEGLTNVVRHANATRARLRLEHDAHHLRLSIADDGRGIGAPAAATTAGAAVAAASASASASDAVGHDPVADRFDEGFGIRTLRERAQAVGGTLAVDPRGGLDGGFLLSLALPRRAPVPDAGGHSDEVDRHIPDTPARSDATSTVGAGAA